MQKIGDAVSQIGVRITDEDRARLQRIAKRQKPGHEQKLADVSRKMLLLGIDVYEDLEKCGIVRVVEFVDEVKRTMREAKRPRQLSILDK